MGGIIAQKLPRLKQERRQRQGRARGPAREIDPVVRQPFPAADVDRLRAAQVERMTLRLLLVFGTEIDGLHGRAEKRVEEGASEP